MMNYSCSKVTQRSTSPTGCGGRSSKTRTDHPLLRALIRSSSKSTVAPALWAIATSETLTTVFSEPSSRVTPERRTSGPRFGPLTFSMDFDSDTTPHQPGHVLRPGHASTARFVGITDVPVGTAYEVTWYWEGIPINEDTDTFDQSDGVTDFPTT